MKSFLFILMTVTFTHCFSQISNSQSSKEVDQYLLNLKESKKTVSNTYFKEEPGLNFDANQKKYIELIQLKKTGLIKIQKLQEEIRAYGFESKTNAIKDIYNLIMDNTAYSISNKTLKIIFDQELFSTSDTNDIPIIWVIKNNHPILIYERKEKSELLSIELPYNSKIENKILKYVRKTNSLQSGEKKIFMEQHTGINDRYFEIEKSLLEEEKINQDLGSNNFIITDLGGLYCGEILNGELNGFGILLNSFGDTIFIGKWRGNFPELMNGKLFQYQIEKNEVFLRSQTNQFIAFAPNGDTYSGMISSNNSCNGKGEFVWTNDNAYSGEWHEGERTGKGTFLWANGYLFQGDFIKGKRTGVGKFYFTNGEIWDGFWVDGEFSGIGKKISKDGNVIKKGLFEKGQLIKSDASKVNQNNEGAKNQLTNPSAGETKASIKKTVDKINTNIGKTLQDLESGAIDLPTAKTYLQSFEALIDINKVMSQESKNSIKATLKVCLGILQGLEDESSTTHTNGRKPVKEFESWLASYVINRINKVIIDVVYNSSDLTNAINELEVFSSLIDANKVISVGSKDSIHIALKVGENILQGLLEDLPAGSTKVVKTVQEFETWLTLFANRLGYIYEAGSAKALGNNTFEGKIKYGTSEEVPILRIWDGSKWVK